jgi:glycosyltransferase involved in cell wall biosynthesis
MKAEVSVVIPTYNCLATLPRAIESVRSQGVAVDIVVVDDCSTDATAAWLAQQNDVRVVQGHHRGVSQARNLGIAACTTPYIAFLDADDFWTESKLATQLALHHENPEMIFSFTDYAHMTEGGEFLAGCFEFWPKFQRLINRKETFVSHKFSSYLYAENVVGTSTVMARRECLNLVGGFDEALMSASDWDLWLRLTELGHVGALNGQFCEYTQDRSTAISRDQSKRLNAMKMILSRYGRQHWIRPMTWLAGQARWVVGHAENQRSQGCFWCSSLLEVAACCLQPALTRIRFSISDVLKGSLQLVSFSSVSITAMQEK